MSETGQQPLLTDWRERVGERLMNAMVCAHDFDDAICGTCWDNTQRIGVLIESEVRAALAEQREAIQESWTEWGIAYGAGDPESAAGVHWVGEEAADAYEMLQWFATPAVLVSRDVRATAWTKPSPEPTP